MLGCFRVGLVWRGLTHDLSKYAPAEFFTGVRYYQGDRSPNAAEREQKGYSEAWMHHKGRNKHHFEYWTDLSLQTMRYEPVDMPVEYLVEMVMDRIAACKTYQGKNYTDASALAYLNKARESGSVHPDTMRKLRFLLQMLAEKGEKETFFFIRKTVLRGCPLRRSRRRSERCRRFVIFVKPVEKIEHFSPFLPIALCTEKRYNTSIISRSGG